MKITVTKSAIAFFAAVFIGVVVLVSVETTMNDGKHQETNRSLRCVVDKTWDGNPVNHDPVDFKLSWRFEKINNRPHNRVIRVEFTAPFNDDPEPPHLPGPCPGLWDYEVVELFFANDKDQYLEVELGPHGHWLCILLDGIRKPFNTGEELELSVTNDWSGSVWKGTAEIPLAYFPGNITKMNAYHIYGTGTDRVYEAMNPVTDGHFTTPDFHRLQFFKPIDRSRFIPPPYGQAPLPHSKIGNMEIYGKDITENTVPH